MTRKQMRYWAYRLRTESGGGSSAEVPSGFREAFEEQHWFLGWDNFALTWDIDEDGKTVPRKFTEYQEWNDKLAEVAMELPIRRGR